MSNSLPSPRIHVAVVVLGLDETLEGEEMDAGNNAESCGDKRNLLLPEPGQMFLTFYCFIWNFVKFAAVSQNP